jgi:zinc and cadmium transporter
MAVELLYILLSVLAVSLVSLTGIIIFSLKKELKEEILLALIAFASGSLIGGAFLHLLPEAINGWKTESVMLFAVIGMLLFFLIEKILFWRHCHEGKCPVHTFTYMSLIGDGIHNLLDGMIIAIAYLTSIPLGIAATIAILAHEVPQEISDFAVLVYGGFKKTKALLFNFLSALTAFLGAGLAFLFSENIEGFQVMLLALAAGGFIYIASTGLIPELHKKKKNIDSVIQLVFLLTGIGLMIGLKTVFK